MFSFKEYQNRIFKSVDRFLLKLRQQKNKPGIAWADYFEEYTFSDTGINEAKVYRAFPKNTKIPFLCLRVPTGGGKTILACEILAKTKSDYLSEKNGLVIWFVPTEAIYSQTLEKLKNPKDIHRQELSKHFGQINVLSKDEALSRLKPVMADDGLTIIISIIDSFSMGEKVYKGGVDGYESFKPRLEKFKPLLIKETKDNSNQSSEVAEDSLFNIIRTYNPVIVIDEGHKYTTELIQTTIADLNPSFIWEFTATPNIGVSNILHRTSPVELKVEQMIKLPIQIHHQPTWQDVIAKAINLQKELEKAAEIELKQTGRYIRPIVLIRPDQITPKEDRITPKEIKKYLSKAQPQIIQDGEKRMLAERYSEGKTEKSGSKRVDTLGEVHKLFEPECNIRYIIAFNAIREGWDCSFAYIYANLSNINSKTDAEQFIGRIMRMPDAKETTQEKLNKSYIVTKGSSNNRSELDSSIDEMIQIMTNSGFSKEEAVQSMDTGKGDSANLPFVSKRQIKTPPIHLPKLSILNKDGEEEELLRKKHLWNGFDISKIELPSNLDSILEKWGVAEIDINKEEEWVSNILEPEVAYGKLFFTADDLAADIARASRDNYFTPKEQLAVILPWVKELVKKNELKELRRNLYLLKECYKETRNNFRDEFAKDKFNKLLKQKKIIASKELYFEVPEEDQNIFYPAGNFSKHLYDQTENLNREEKDFAGNYLQAKNIKWFYRNRETKDFFIQGYWGKFYPDFIFQTTDGKLGAAEYKGREDDLDKEKKLLGETYSKLSHIIFGWNNVG